MTSGSVSGVGDVSGDLTAPDQKHKLRLPLQSGTGPMWLIVTPLQSNHSRELFSNLCVVCIINIKLS